jgi:hypothetical protein
VGDGKCAQTLEEIGVGGGVEWQKAKVGRIAGWLSVDWVVGFCGVFNTEDAEGAEKKRGMGCDTPMMLRRDFVCLRGLRG